MGVHQANSLVCILQFTFKIHNISGIMVQIINPTLSWGRKIALGSLTMVHRLKNEKKKAQMNKHLR